MTITKQDIIDIIATKTQMTENTAKAMLRAYIEAVMEALSRGDSVQLIGFGKFEVRLRKARKGRNPRTGAEIQIPAKTVPVFRLTVHCANLSLTGKGKGVGMLPTFPWKEFNMNHLLFNYLINGGFTLLKVVLFVIIAAISFIIMDSSLWKVDITKLLKEGNVGALIFLGLYFLALAYCVGQL